MPANKNAVIRYKYLDELLSNKYHYYDIHDLTEKINDRLKRDGYEEVVQRTVEKDLVFLSSSPFSAPIEHTYQNGRYIISYSKTGYSIFTKELSKDEELLLSEVLNTLGQFEGLANFTWLDGLKDLVGVRNHSTVISFSSNPMTNSNLLGRLFTAISNKQVIELTYHRFNQPSKSIKVHPYLLKQFNNRWFLICAADEDDFILTFALDRIDQVKELPEDVYRKCSVDLKNRFEHIVGVTVGKESIIEKIILWVSDSGFGYINSKPLHASQSFLNLEEEKVFRKNVPYLSQGRFLKLNCMVNTELINLILSYGDELVVLEPEALRKTIIEKIKAQNKNYLLDPI